MKRLPNLQPKNKKIIIIQDVEFNENIVYIRKQKKLREKIINVPIIQRRREKIDQDPRSPPQ